MPVTSVKICGIMNIETLQAILHLPIDQIGFVFAPSKRQVTPEYAREMISVLQQKAKDSKVPQTVGVFVNPSKDELLRLLKAAPLDVVQLHGQESADLCQWVKETFKVKVFKAVSIPIEPLLTDEHLRLLEPYRGVVDAVLLDTYDPIVGGGTGKTYAWNRIPDYLTWTQEAGMKLIVAGGLDVNNVAGLIHLYHPDGVDISSGVETNGIKDVRKIQAFAERVKGS